MREAETGRAILEEGIGRDREEGQVEGQVEDQLQEARRSLLLAGRIRQKEPDEVDE